MGPGMYMSLRVQQLVLLPPGYAPSADKREAAAETGPAVAPWTLSAAKLFPDRDNAQIALASISEDEFLVASWELRRCISAFYATNPADHVARLRNELSAHSQSLSLELRSRAIQACEYLLLQSPSTQLAALLLSLSCIERFIGDILFTLLSQTCRFTQSKVALPHLFRELLMHPALEAILSSDQHARLWLVIGPPSGMNVRNVMWHGFFDDCFAANMAHLYALMLLDELVIVSHTWKSLVQTETDAPPCPCRDCPDLDPALFYPDYLLIASEQAACCSLATQTSAFVPCGQISLYYTATKHFAGSRDPVAFLLCTLPMLEHALRLCWASVNNVTCPHRALVADHTSLYCIIDDIFSPIVAETGFDNKLANHIGTGATELLLDLFVYPRGPRLRDRIAHGECSTAASLLLSWANLLRSLFNYLDATISLREVPLSFRWLSLYRSRFHPVSFLNTELRAVVDDFSALCSECATKLDVNYPIISFSRTYWMPLALCQIASNIGLQIASSLRTTIERFSQGQLERSLSSRHRQRYLELQHALPRIIAFIDSELSLILGWLVNVSNVTQWSEMDRRAFDQNHILLKSHHRLQGLLSTLQSGKYSKYAAYN